MGAIVGAHATVRTLTSPTREPEVAARSYLAKCPASVPERRSVPQCAGAFVRAAGSSISTIRTKDTSYVSTTLGHSLGALRKVLAPE